MTRVTILFMFFFIQLMCFHSKTDVSRVPDKKNVYTYTMEFNFVHSFLDIAFVGTTVYTGSTRENAYTDHVIRLSSRILSSLFACVQYKVV